MILLAWLLLDEVLHCGLEEMDLSNLILTQKFSQSSLDHFKLLSVGEGDFRAESGTNQD